jgi:hypothetical protein
MPPRLFYTCHYSSFRSWEYSDRHCECEVEATPPLKRRTALMKMMSENECNGSLGAGFGH